MELKYRDMHLDPGFAAMLIETVADLVTVLPYHDAFSRLLDEYIAAADKVNDNER
jgi:hypothetical protein